ncbi:hypothetical protein SLS60_007723 [Paraconiothyrium brasiliense]|uniref:Uncharacterized protein n=1 Tax=Paraconiothyrium brasiliense TaxID=300254 RepID=A0ABR3R654_9PLEO
MDRLKSAFAKLSSNSQAPVASNDRPADGSPQAALRSNTRLAWPPKFACPPRLLGEVKDVSGRQYPRDLGRSVELGGHMYYIFGDTFCFNDNGDFVGVTNNSIALIPDMSNPTKSKYMHPDPKVPEFVPYTHEEKEFCERPENTKANRRIKTDADFADKTNYQFLKKSGKWESTYTQPHGPFGELAHDVLCGQGQGAIVHVPEFAPLGKEYLWIGCAKFMVSKLYVGAAPRPEGPWDVHELGEMPKITDHAKTRYCIYPHLWGSNLGEGKILITWSDDGTLGGKVAAGMFTFALE